MLAGGDVVGGTETQGESKGRRNRAEVSKPSYGKATQSMMFKVLFY